MAVTEAQLRLLLNDNPGGGGTDILSTANYTTLLAIETNIYRAAAIASRAIASTFALRTSISVSGVKSEQQQKFDHYIMLAKDYDLRASQGGASGTSVAPGLSPELTGISIDAVDAVHDDTDRVQGVFRIGVMDNPDNITIPPKVAIA